MRLDTTAASLVLALCCVHNVSSRHVLQARQESSDAVTTTAASTTPSSTNNAARDSTTPIAKGTSSNGQSTIDQTSESSDQATSTTVRSDESTVATASATLSSDRDAASAITISTTTSASNSATSSPTAVPTRDPLPLQPKITPAIGIAGAILIITGIALCLVGIKHRWLYIFLSAAFLTSLAVTVLIVYVMNPPVSDAVQGAYMVAGVITGLVFGSLSLVFKEVTDGLGCLLGGFCLAMWFLVLSPGGLITSTSGRAVLIAVFSIVCFAASFSHYTRNYGLILCTSFAGASITILGIDCFSRAGLKEFWIYLWHLNDDEFPLGTNTYPITRGIRVEIACTIIIFLFGVMSQFKIWKVIKKRREKKDADRLRDDEDKDQLESEVGKQIEQSNQRDRAHWEAVYGDKHGSQNHADSGVGSSVESFPKRSASVREREEDNIEMADMQSVADKGGSKSKPRTMVTVRVASDDSIAHEPESSRTNLLDKGEISRTPSHKSTRYTNSRNSSDSQSAKEKSFRSSGPSQPAITPLPFSIPREHDEEAGNADGESVRSHGTAGRSVHERRGIPLNHLSLKKHDGGDVFNSARIEDDRASSVAATADDEADLDMLSAPQTSAMPSPYDLSFDRDALAPSKVEGPERSQTPGAMSAGEVPVDENDEEALERPLTAVEKEEEIGQRVDKKHRASVVSSRRRSTATKRSSRRGDSDDEDNVSVVGSLMDHLPEKLSKIALTYRTNEWAKHIAEADKPEAEEVPFSTSPGMQVDHAFAEEAAKPVEVQSLAPASRSTGPPHSVSHETNRNPYRRSREMPQLSRASSSATVTPVYAFSRSNSQASLQRQSSNATISQPQPATSGTRNASAPLASQTLVESPIEDALASSGPYRNVSAPLGMSSNNLMDQRNTILKQKPTTTSFAALSSTPNVNLIAPSDSASSHNVGLDGPDSDNISLSERKQMIDEENMTLAQRKELMQQVQQRDRRRSNQDNWPLPQRFGSVSQKDAIYDSHQPKRTATVDTVKQNTMLTNWRRSLQADTSTKEPLLAGDNARAAMINERRQAEWEQHRAQAEKVSRESVIDMAMRSGQLHGAHRDAMRRMQAKASRNGS